MTKDSIIDHRRGISIAGFGVFVLSFDALLVRLVNTDAVAISFWRGALVFISMMIFMLLSRRMQEFKAYRAHGVSALLVTLLYSASTIMFVYSVSHTNVANAVVILSSSAFFAAFFSWIILKESVPRATWIAIFVAMSGVLIVFSGSSGVSDWRGDLMALVTAMIMGLSLTLLRRLSAMPKMPVVALSGLVAALFMLPFAYSKIFQLEPVSYAWLSVMGLVQIPVASVMLMMATKYLPSPEVSLFLLIETTLGPVWVWFVIHEAVPPLTLVGGSAILGAIFFHSLLALKKPKAALV